LLLPFIYTLRERGVSAEYGHPLAHMALKDFFLELPNGKQDYMSAIGTAMRELYQKASKKEDARYFLDKTPRYALIADEIINIFPDGKFIFLWRNPLAIIASMIETWGEGKWNIPWYRVDLYDGLANLIDAYQAHTDKVLAIRYENFLQSPEAELSRIAEYLGLDIDPVILKKYSQVSFKGNLGDPTGTRDYKEVDTAPLEKWKAVINNPLRKSWCRGYLHWLGAERLKVMGYDLNDLLRDLDSTPMTARYLFSDVVRFLNIKARIKNILRRFGRIFFR